MKSQRGDSGAGWSCIETAAGLLTPPEREIVLGDLAETDHGTLRGLMDVLGLAARRQIALWKNWRPWAASLGLALPASLFLMGCSVASSGAFARLLQKPDQSHLLWLFVSRIFLLIGWAWMAGFAVGSVSPRTWWASLLGCCAPCVDCLSKWPVHGFSELQLLIFLIPGLRGAWRGRQHLRLSPGWAFFLVTIAMLAPIASGKGGWMYGCSLLWSGCYLVSTAVCRSA